MFKLFKKREEQIAVHHVHIDTRDLRYLREDSGISIDECESYAHAYTEEPLSFQTFRPRIVDLLNATEDLPASKELYVCFNPGFFKNPDLIKKWLNRIPGTDILWCREPKSKFFRCICSSSGLDVLVKVSHKSAALELFDNLDMDSRDIDDGYVKDGVHWIEFAILDKRWCDAVLETHSEYNILSFTGLEALKRESDYFIYCVDCEGAAIFEGFEACYETIAYGAAAPAALRQLVNRWGIPISLQRPGRS